MPGRTALLVGATGLVGRHCLERLLTEPAYTSITVLARRDPGYRDSRLDVRIVDFDTLSAADVPAVDDVYCALGTTMAVAKSRDAFHRVDHDYPLAVGELAYAAGARRFGLVSSIGASLTSRTYYLRVKGEIERDIAAIGYDTLEVLRPSGLVGKRDDRRIAEWVTIPIARALSGALFGRLRPYRTVPGSQVANALVTAVLAGEPGTHFRTYDDIVRLSTQD